MTNKSTEDRTSQSSGPTQPRRGQGAWLIATVLLASIGLMFYFANSNVSQIDYGFFQEQLEKENLQSVTVYQSYIQGQFAVPPDRPATFDSEGNLKEATGEKKKLYRDFACFIPADSSSRANLLQQINKLREKSQAEGRPFELIVAPESPMNIGTLVSLALLFATAFVIYMFFRRSRDGMMGGGFLSSFTRSTAKRFEPSDQNVTFDDVAGLEGVKADLQEIVDFLKAPEKFQKLGGRVPKGVLLNGPPGTGKTLLARAIAGEAGVAFFSVNGSEFIQMFVGVGASRVRDLFATAKEQSPAIVFIDEIDAVGRQRGAGLGGGHDEREQTLNQILGEMDGFAPNDSVIIMAATNRPDVLDPALLRPGRFDRHITVGRPTLKGREAIFKVHVRDVPLDKDVDLHTLAEATVGLTGADIRNVVNEAALWAARHDKTRVGMDDFDHARDKVLMGAKREEVMQPSEKEKTAYHEAGHTLAAWFLPGAQRVHKVTVIPRGMSLGSTQIIPAEDRMNMAENEIRDQLVVLLAGRAAEKIFFDETSVGAENDLERATSLARRMISHWGMSQKLGPVSYKLSD
ncbi:MAG: ATP-dependent zinc metalloprotease FtsH, partial [Pirellula sp.]